MKDLSIHLWCSNYSKSSNHIPRERNKPCCHPWTYKDTSRIFQNINYYLIQDYLTVELEPPVKKIKKMRPSSIRIDNILLSQVQVVKSILPFYNFHTFIFL